MINYFSSEIDSLFSHFATRLIIYSTALVALVKATWKYDNMIAYTWIRFFSFLVFFLTIRSMDHRCINCIYMHVLFSLFGRKQNGCSLKKQYIVYYLKKGKFYLGPHKVMGTKIIHLDPPITFTITLLLFTRYT